MNLTDYTSYDEIRAVLGVSDDEIEDQTLGLPIYENQLGFEFDDISPTLIPLLDALDGQSSKTADELRLERIVSVFAAHAVARHLLMSLPLFAPKRVTDGRAETDRFVDPFTTLTSDVTAAYHSIRRRLVQALGAAIAPQPAGTPREYLAVSRLAVDPVTG